MPRKETEIKPGSTFFLPAAQEKNLTTLLGVLGKKEAAKAIEAIGKTDTNSWTKIDNVVGNLNSIVEAGGISPIIMSFKEAVQLQLNAFVTPLTNQINTLVAESLAPMKEQIQDIFNDLGTFVADNPEGGAVGAIIGGIVGLFLPGGEIWAVVGAMLGSGGQSLFEAIGVELTNFWLGITGQLNDIEETIPKIFEPLEDTLERARLERISYFDALSAIMLSGTEMGTERGFQFGLVSPEFEEMMRARILAALEDPVILRTLLRGKLADLEEDF